MKTQALFRKIHHWGSVIIVLPLAVVIGTGVLLMLKKEINWIQPPTQRGVERTAIPQKSFQDLFNAAKAVPEAEISSWADLERVDVKAGKGVVKFVSESQWEVQVDTHTAEILQTAYRRSDIIEAIHDGSWFADWAKLGLFLPAGIVLFILWLTGLYLFIITEHKRHKKRKKKARKNKSH